MPKRPDYRDATPKDLALALMRSKRPRRKDNDLPDSVEGQQVERSGKDKLDTNPKAPPERQHEEAS